MTKGWTDERRQKARERILKNKPWEKSTGPKTKAGKEKSSLNALKHGMCSRVLLERLHQIKLINTNTIKIAYTFQYLDKISRYRRNELIKKSNKNKGKANATQK